MKEALILKVLKHPGIPVLYDYEEDSRFGYLIEEYIKGESLKSLKESQTNFTNFQLINIAKDLCNVIIYLHHLKPYPVLYLDLKPEHIIISETSLRLIDYGAAIMKKGRQIAGGSMGTKGFASPEQIDGREIDERTDVYNIGAVLFWLMTGEVVNPYESENVKKEKMERFSKEWKQIISKCIAACVEERYQSVETLKKEIQYLEKVKKNSQSEKTLTIAVLGSQSHTGVTHFAIGLTVYCYKNGISCLYEEKNDSGALQQLFKYQKNVMENNGLYYYKGFVGIPRYGPAVCSENDNFKIFIQDYGYYDNQELKEFERADYKIIILGDKEWEFNKNKEVIKYAGNQINCCYVLKPTTFWHYSKVLRELELSKAYRMVSFENPFMIGRLEQRFYQKLQKQVFPIVKGRKS